MDTEGELLGQKDLPNYSCQAKSGPTIKHGCPINESMAKNSVFDTFPPLTVDHFSVGICTAGKTNCSRFAYRNLGD